MDSRDFHLPWATASSCPIGIDADRLHEQVVSMYARVARQGDQGQFHFHVGAAYAVQRLGYDARALARVPAACSSRFAGVGNPFAAGPVPAGATVLDHACGAGCDLLLAALQAGPGARAIGIDATPAMRELAADGAAAAGLSDRVRILEGRFEMLPLADGGIDLVISNGVLNLATDKLRVLREAHRVLRPGGELRLADVLLGRPLSPLARGNSALWSACVGGALTEAELLQLLQRAGFAPPHALLRHDCFAGTTLPLKFGQGLQVSSITLALRKPG
jgi:arsenite methyltransferase